MLCSHVLGWWTTTLLYQMETLQKFTDVHLVRCDFAVGWVDRDPCCLEEQISDSNQLGCFVVAKDLAFF